jgi:hypothetical protein
VASGKLGRSSRNASPIFLVWSCPTLMDEELDELERLTLLMLDDDEVQATAH